MRSNAVMRTALQRLADAGFEVVVDRQAHGLSDRWCRDLAVPIGIPIVDATSGNGIPR